MSSLPCDIKNIDLEKSSWSDLAKNDSHNVTDFSDNQIHEMAGILKIFSSSFVVHAISSEKLLTSFPYNAACGNESNEKRRG